MNISKMAAVPLAALAWSLPVVTQVHGPIGVNLPAGGDSCKRAIGHDGTSLIAGAQWTPSSWIEPSGQAGYAVIVPIAQAAIAGPAPRAMAR